MTRDPVRYLQDSGTEPRLAQLLGGSSPPLDLPAAVQARVGATLQQLVSTAASTSVAANATTAAKSGWLAAGIAKPLALIGAVSAAAVIGGVAFSNLGTHSAAVENHPAFVASAQAPQRLPLAAPPVEAPTPTVSDLPLDPDSNRAAPRAVSKQQPRGTAVASAPGRSNLAEEARLLETVRSSIATDPVAARRTLSEYDARFPRGALKEERGLLAVKLAVAEGRRGEAKEQAIQMEQNSKSSPYSKKAREVTGSIEREPGSRTSNE